MSAIISLKLALCTSARENSPAEKYQMPAIDRFEQFQYLREMQSDFSPDSNGGFPQNIRNMVAFGQTVELQTSLKHMTHVLS